MQLIKVFIQVVLFPSLLGYQVDSGFKNCDTRFLDKKLIPQTTKPPFVVQAAGKLVLEQNQTVTFLLIPSKFEQSFQGFLLKVFKSRDSSYEAVGRFDLDDQPSDIRVIDCGNTKHSAVTHSNSHDKWVVKMKWLPPPGEGVYEIETTWISNKTMIWLREKSGLRIYVKSDINLAKQDTQNPNQDLSPLSYLESGSAFLFVVQLVAYTLVGLFLLLTFTAVCLLYMPKCQRRIIQFIKTDEEVELDKKEIEMKDLSQAV